MRKGLAFILSILLVLFTFSGCINKSIDKSTTINNNDSIVDKDTYNDEKVDDNTIDEENNNKDDSSTVADKDSDKGKLSDILLKDIVNKAKEGAVIDCTFKAKYNIIDDVKAEWGNEEKFDHVEDAKGDYFTFKDKNEVFGVNKGGVIFEVRTFSDKIKNLSFEDIETFFGTPDYDIISALNERIVGYVINDEFKILLVFNNGSEKNPKLDHYSVLYPKGTVNLMADDPGREW